MFALNVKTSFLGLIRKEIQNQMLSAEIFTQKGSILTYIYPLIMQIQQTTDMLFCLIRKKGLDSLCEMSPDKKGGGGDLINTDY